MADTCFITLFNSKDSGTHTLQSLFLLAYRNIKSGMLKTSEFFMGSICHKYINMADGFMICPAAMDSLQPLAACISKY